MSNRINEAGNGRATARSWQQADDAAVGVTDNSGDLWITATLTGSATDAAAGLTGRATAWFGVEQNNRSFTSSFIAEAIGTLSNGTSLDIHLNGTFTVKRPGRHHGEPNDVHM